MLKRRSVNFAVFSMALDLGRTIHSLVPWPLYLAIALIWLCVFLALAVYDPQRTYKAVDEYQNVFVATVFAALIFAGFLYLSYRDVSRWLFIAFAVLDLTSLLGWRVLARFTFRLLNDRAYRPQRC